MSGNDAPEDEIFPLSGLFDGSSLFAGQAPVSEIVGRVIDAVSKDAAKVFQPDAASQTEVEKAATQITIDLIGFVAGCVRNLLPAGAAAAPPHDCEAGNNPPASPGAPQDPMPQAPQ